MAPDGASDATAGCRVCHAWGRRGELERDIVGHICCVSVATNETLSLGKNATEADRGNEST